ncbi:MAG: hypothetical protein WBF43_12730 [Methylocella sp.]
MKEIFDRRVTGMVTYPLDEIPPATLAGPLCGADDGEASELLSREGAEAGFAGQDRHSPRPNVPQGFPVAEA